MKGNMLKKWFYKDDYDNDVLLVERGLYCIYIIGTWFVLLFSFLQLRVIVSLNKSEGSKENRTTMSEKDTSELIEV